MSDPAPAFDPSLPSQPKQHPKKPALSGWRLGLVFAAGVALFLRGLLALVSFSVHPASPKSADAALPAWPLKAGDVFTLKAGDPVIAKWAANPDNDGYVVQLVQQNGQPVTDTKVCALEPDYMADASQPGGTLTLLTEDGTGDWRVHWTGGDTLPANDSPPAPDSATADTVGPANANCGKDAVFTMSLAQLHSWYNMQAAVVTGNTTANDTPDTQSAPTEKQ